MKLLASIKDKIEKHSSRARFSSGTPVPLETILAAALRWLAGGSYLDICINHGISTQQFYLSLWEVIDAINEEKKICFPWDDK